MPVGRHSWRRALAGGVTAALLWEVTRHLLLWYFQTLSRVGVVYGSLTTAIVVLLSLEIAATLLLLGGQVLPLVLLAVAPSVLALFATLAAFLPRLIGVARFRQSLIGAVLHPIGICALVAIQWFAFFRSLRKRPAVWKGRSYAPVTAT